MSKKSAADRTAQKCLAYMPFSGKRITRNVALFFLLTSCFLFVLDVARYAFKLITKHLLNNQIKTVQNLMTDLGYFHDLYFSI